MTAIMEDEAYWSEAWKRHVENYLAAPPRFANWLKMKYPKEAGLSFMEIAGGSCRDSQELAEAGYDAVGTDFDQKTLDYLAERFPGAERRLRREDAFNFALPGRAVDVTFSNGFWVLFEDDEKVLQLLREQVRVTRKYAIFVTQSDENPALKREFARLAETDDLYDIRFFSRAEVEDLVRRSGVSYKQMTFEKFGGKVDALYMNRIKGVPNPLAGVAGKLAPRLYSKLPWSAAQRIVCTLEL